MLVLPCLQHQLQQPQVSLNFCLAVHKLLQLGIQLLRAEISFQREWTDTDH